MKSKFQKIVIFYFSGTGNAKNTAFWVADEAKKLGIDTTLVNIAEKKTISASEIDENSLIGFISPTHGFHFPKIMRSFIRTFPKIKNCKTFIVNTRAGLRIGKLFLPGLSGLVHYCSSIILRVKGFKIVGLQPVDLPSNWISIHPAVREKGVNLIYKHVEPKVRRFATRILNGKKSYRAFYGIIPDALISPIAILYMLFGKYFLAKTFIASADCNLCGLCLNTCPVNAIKQIDNRMFWTHKCESCMKCMNSCPQRAIETAHGFVGLSIVLSSILTYFFEKLLYIQPFSDWQILQNNTIEFLILSVIFLPIFFLLYRIMHRLMRFKLFERIFVLTSFTKFKFWGRYSQKLRKNN